MTSSRTPVPFLLRRRGAVALLGALLVLGFAATPAIASRTIVSLTFDDGRADQYQAKDLMAQYGMKGTFYINSGRVTNGLPNSDPFYMTWSQLNDLALAGNEIGGHTIDHPDLTTLSTSAAQAEICDDRQALIARGFNPISFAYPFSASNATIRQMVQGCGYTSGRGVGNNQETIPPRDPFLLRTPTDIQSSTSLSTIQGYITNAESVGGTWVVLVFHSICNGCGTNSITPANFNSLLQWLQPRSSIGTEVRTVGSVITNPPDIPPKAPTGLVALAGDGRVSLDWADNAETDLAGYDVYRATTSGGPYTKLTDSRQATSNFVDATATNGTNWYYAVTATDAGNNESNRARDVLSQPHAGTDLRNASLEVDANNDGVPDCWQKLGYGTNTFTFSMTSDAHTGLFGEREDMTAYTNGDRKLVVTQDTGNCALPIVPGASYRISAWYKSTAATYFVAFQRTPEGAWNFWKSGPLLAAAAQWTQASWTTPALPSTATLLSFGLNLDRLGTLNADDFQITSP